MNIIKNNKQRNTKDSYEIPHESLMQYRSEIINAKRKTQEDFDKTLLTLSSGAFGLSLIFIKDILDINKAINLTLLYVSWKLWIISLISLLLGYRNGILAHKKVLTLIDNSEINKLYKNGGEPYTTRIEIFNIIGMWTFLIGLILITCFVTLNLGAIK